MYVVTFYSFKGGVGRTLALANIGFELARAGRRVLLVDFDLEAPGLDTIREFRPSTPHMGIVDYVRDFTNSGHSPDVKEYIYECASAPEKGALWVMPAGTRDAKYTHALHRIDWRELYSHRDGFLMVEDLREQWDQALNPEYVLIDSRTGHTDIGGICTRQLPDAVVILFFPNEQNLEGLRPIVHGIRVDQSKSRRGSIEMHFVMSNVPDLDDEEGILANLAQRFRAGLEYDVPRVIHRYESLSLLEQSLFVQTHPRSRLTSEYRQLLEDITARNPEDRRGSLKWLKRLRQETPSLPGIWTEYEKRVENIIAHHSADPEVLYAGALAYRRYGSVDTFKALLEKAIQSGARDPAAFLDRAEIGIQTPGGALAVADILRALSTEKPDVFAVSRGIDLLQSISPDRLPQAMELPSVTRLNLDDQLRVGLEMRETRQGQLAVVNLLSKHLTEPTLSEAQQDNVRNQVVLAYIGLRRFKEALELHGATRPRPEELEYTDAFNYGVAEWGAVGSPRSDMFHRVLSEIDQRRRSRIPNYCQCLALASWVCGDQRTALEYLDEAEKLMRRKPWFEFSCWRYLNVSPKTFLIDCRALRAGITEGRVVPSCLSPST